MASLKRKGIFCLETDWWGVKDTTTVEPVLHLHRGIGTRGEFEYYIQKVTTKGLSRYPVLYLGFHGEPGCLYLGDLYLGDRRGRKGLVTLDELADLLEGKCKGKVIHFGSCSTLDVHGQTLKAFLRKTNALALLGYRGTTDWLESAAFEGLLLGELQSRGVTRPGMKALEKRVRKIAPGLYKALGFRMVV